MYKLINKYFSIIIVTYNCGKSFAKTIESILNQTFRNFEIIVIDGGSETYTLNCIEKYKDDITFFLSEQDKGIYDAMNKGIKFSNGEYLFFLNTGDSFNTSNILLEIYQNTIEDLHTKRKIDLIYGNIVLANSTRIIRGTDKLSKYFFFKSTICHQSIFYNSNLFVQNKLYDLEYKVISDRVNLFLLYINKYNFKKINVIICLWDPIGFSISNKKIMDREVIIFQHKYYNIFERLFMNIFTKFKSFFK